MAISGSVFLHARPFGIQKVLRFKNGPFLPLLFVTSFLYFLVRMKLCAGLCKNEHLFFSYDTEATRTTYQVRGTRYLYSSSSYCCHCSLQQVPHPYCCTKRVTPLESSHGHHLPTRAGSARAARGRGFNPQRAATAPGCRACSATREHRVGSVGRINSGSQRQQHEELVDNSWRWLTHPTHRPPPVPHREFLAECRASVGLYATASVCVRRS